MADLKPGQILIHGKPYDTVNLRVQNFWGNPHHEEWSITTEVLDTGDNVLVKATIRDANGREKATGHAEEKRGATMILRTSAIEVAETSAIGRCLACLGMSGSGEYASANEVEEAIRKQQEQEGNKLDIDPDLVKRVVAATLEHIKNKDALGMREVWDELPHQEQGAVWREFNSHQKKAIRDLLQEGAKNAQADTA